MCSGAQIQNNCTEDGSLVCSPCIFEGKEQLDKAKGCILVRHVQTLHMFGIVCSTPFVTFFAGGVRDGVSFQKRLHLDIVKAIMMLVVGFL